MSVSNRLSWLSKFPIDEVVVYIILGIAAFLMGAIVVSLFKKPVDHFSDSCYAAGGFPIRLDKSVADFGDRVCVKKIELLHIDINELLKDSAVVKDGSKKL